MVWSWRPVPARKPLYSDPDSPFIREVLEVTGKTSPRTVSYGTDGAAFTAMKHLVVYGPGSIAQAHTHDEWIALDQLQRGTDAFAALATPLVQEVGR